MGVPHYSTARILRHLIFALALFYILIQQILHSSIICQSTIYRSHRKIKGHCMFSTVVAHRGQLPEDPEQQQTQLITVPQAD